VLCHRTLVRKLPFSVHFRLIRTILPFEPNSSTWYGRYVRVAAVAHLPWFSGSGFCVCAYLYKIAWFGHNNGTAAPELDKQATTSRGRGYSRPRRTLRCGSPHPPGWALSASGWALSASWPVPSIPWFVSPNSDMPWACRDFSIANQRLRQGQKPSGGVRAGSIQRTRWVNPVGWQFL
jgi:hypothetical protein